MNLRELKNISGQLATFIDHFQKDLGRIERRYWCKMYLSGLMLNGERKSIQPMAQRLPGGNEQALQQFVSQSPWDSKVIQEKLTHLLIERFGSDEGLLILDDTSFPKKGNKSVGVSRQYCGALGKIANCQSIVTWHYSGKQGYHFPISAELFLPKQWTTSIKAMEGAGVPERRFEFQKKWQLALELLDQRIVGKFPYKAVVFDAGYGEVREFLGELDQREITFVAQIPESHSFWPIEIPLNYDNTGKGRPRCYPEIKDKTLQPLSCKKWL